jgi:hypothetical protein
VVLKLIRNRASDRPYVEVVSSGLTEPLRAGHRYRHRVRRENSQKREGKQRMGIAFLGLASLMLLRSFLTCTARSREAGWTVIVDPGGEQYHVQATP